MSQLRYINQFLSFRCAADIIGVSGPVSKFSKEISEAMAIIRRIKPKMVKSPMTCTLVDLCSGNALVPLISAFMLPSKWNYAIDKRPRNRHWNKVQRFIYLHTDIHDEEIVNFINHIDGPVILTAVHPCKELAIRTAKLYNETKAEMLVMMPCCLGKKPLRISKDLEAKIGKDNLWGIYLNSLVDGRLIQDNDVISPRNRIIIAEKE